MVSKLEILLFCALLVSLIGISYFAFVIPSICPQQLKQTVEVCNANMEAKMVNNCQQSYYTNSNWDIRDYTNASQTNKILQGANLTIETGLERLNKRLNGSK